MDNIIHLSIILKMDAKEAFRHFIDKGLLESWLTTIAEVEPKSGGKYELFWNPTDRANDSTIGCKITAIEEDQLIAFEWRSPKQFKHFANNADPLTHVVVSFTPGDKNKTVVHLIHSGWRSSEEWEEARTWQERAWRMAFANLEKMTG